MADHIIHSLPRIIPDEHRWKVTLFKEWKNIMGNVADKAHLYKINNDSIIITVSHPSWAQELSLLSSVIQDKINHVLDKPRITALHFRMRSTMSPLQSQARKQHTSYNIDHTIPVTLSAKEKKALQSIASEDLRSALSDFYKTCKARVSNKNETHSAR